jgi:Domain of unknown function (DUF5753)
MELASEESSEPGGSPLACRIPRVGLEAQATSISDCGLGAMPGLLQTPDYARAVVQVAVPKRVPEVVERVCRAG